MINKHNLVKNYTYNLTEYSYGKTFFPKNIKELKNLLKKKNILVKTGDCGHGDKSSLKKKEYVLIGYKGKQVRDNIHSEDLASCFWEFYKNPRCGEVYNTGGGRFSNCSILEALHIVEKVKGIKIKKKRIFRKNHIVIIHREKSSIDNFNDLLEIIEIAS